MSPSPKNCHVHAWIWNPVEPHDLHVSIFFPCKYLYWIYNIQLCCNNEHCIHQGTLAVTKVDKIHFHSLHSMVEIHFILLSFLFNI